MNELIKKKIESLNISKYRSPTGRMKKDTPPGIKTLIKISEFIEKYGWDAYEYSQFEYTGSACKGVVSCPKHGAFSITPGNHLKGQGCPQCGNQRAGSKLRKAPDKAIRDFIGIHGDEYDYSKTQYITAKDPIIVTCKIHGDFEIIPNKHLSGEGCPDCRYIKSAKSMTKSLEVVLRDFRLTHGGLYDYSKVVYTKAKEKVEIICQKHGSFWQTPDSHQQGSGCPKCMNKHEDTIIIYLLKCANTGLYKIGITNDLAIRMRNIGGSLTYIDHQVLDNPRQHEKILHKRYQEVRRFNSNVNNGGTEFFQLSSEQVEEIKYYFNSLQ